MFKTTQANIPQIKATIKVYGQCWFHGCGNIYDNESASNFRQKFSNPNSEESIYRIHFISVSQVPTTVEELNKMLMASRSQEIVKEKMPKTAQEIKTISVDDEEAPVKKKTKKEKDQAIVNDDDAELQRLIDEENANKGI